MSKHDDGGPASEIRALALLAGIEPREIHELPNGYWPDTDHYRKIRAESPWLLFICDGGTFTIGWRKRVLQVSWTHGDVDPITEEGLKWITHGPRMFHAYDWVQALLFLARVVTQLRARLAEQARKESTMRETHKRRNDILVELGTIFALLWAAVGLICLGLWLDAKYHELRWGCEEPTMKHDDGGE